jgi:hypothetical protein
VIPDQQGEILYWLAVVGALLLLIWWVVDGHYTRVRNAAQAARRAAILLGGLDEPLSPAEVQALRERFTISVAEAHKCEMADYYATKLPPGPARLGEMLEESAFYSERLQRISANIMLVLLVIFAAIFVVIAFGVTPYVASDTAHTIVRIFLAMLVFAMSSDVVGAVLGAPCSGAGTDEAAAQANELRGKFEKPENDNSPLGVAEVPRRASRRGVRASQA